MKRRNFLTGLGASALSVAFFKSAIAKQIGSSAQATGRVVVVGGGMAGTTVAKFLRLWGGNGVEVTLVEPNATYYSNIFSNMVLTGERTLNQLSFNYTTLSSKYGVRVENSSVTNIDPVGQTVVLSNGTRLNYDRLVLAPGIDFEPLTWSGGTADQKAKIVHAWKAGAQTTSLKNQIQSMTNKDTFIITVPPSPFRCPPGPYERACVVADYLKRTKGGGKVVILDANSGIQAGVNNFTNAFNGVHKDTITYVPNAHLESIDASTMTVFTSEGSFNGKVINAIPVHRAGNLISQSNIGLNNAGNGKWAGVDVLTYESTNPDLQGIHIIGDSSATTQPKAGHLANAEAKVCADAIIQYLKGDDINQNPMTNSSCFTPITLEKASWLSVVYRYDPGSGKMMPTGPGVTESNGATSDNYEDMLKWFTNLMSDTFA
ncbi:MAG TPA: FAD/NAD(P)-binding oxidoreductase [Draconibacterium sp.]|nr:FAD/NAD(P)-binding oxidoreductase [Draconibacterium sp.]